MGIHPTFSRTLERALTKEFARRNLEINADHDILFVRQDGLEGIDLSGNVSTRIIVQHDDQPAIITIFSNIPSDPYGKLDGNKIKMEQYAFQNVGDIKGLVAWVAQVRVVVQGDDTIMEEDDIVKPQVFGTSRTITLWRNPEVLYLLHVKYDSDDEKCSAALMHYKRENAPPRLIAFKSWEEGFRFLEHIRTKYLAEKRRMKLGQETSLELFPDFRVGFTIDPSGKDMPDRINILWLDRAKKPVDLTRVSLYRTESDDYPLEARTVLPEGKCD